MSYFIYQNKKIFFEEYGDGIPLLLLHGNSLSSRMFLPIIDDLQKYTKVILTIPEEMTEHVQTDDN